VHKLATGAAWLRVLILTVHEQHRMKHSDPARYESGPTGRDDLKRPPPITSSGAEVRVTTVDARS